MHRHVLRCFDTETNLRTIHAEGRHDDVRTDPNDLTHSPRQYQHVSLRACLEMTMIAAMLLLRCFSMAGPFVPLTLRSFFAANRSTPFRYAVPLRSRTSPDFLVRAFATVLLTLWRRSLHAARPCLTLT